MYQKVVDVAEQIGVTIEKTDNGVCQRRPTRRNIFAYLLSYIVSLSFTKSIFTDCLKHAKFCPIHRARSKREVENFLPISVLPASSKIFERPMFNPLSNFIKNENVLYKKQIGFQPKRSAQNKFTFCMLLDTKKAFDTIDHSKLLQKFPEYDARGFALECFKSYLTNRTRCVKLGNCLSQVEVIIFGVLQGSVLGPMLFVHYINDLPLCCEQLDPYMFADDTNLLYESNLLNTYTLNDKLNQIASWFAENKLCLNSSKTQLIKFSNISLYVTLSTKTLHEFEFVKYLGLFLDRDFKYGCHIKKIVRKNSPQIIVCHKPNWKNCH